MIAHDELNRLRLEIDHKRRQFEFTKWILIVKALKYKTLVLGIS